MAAKTTTKTKTAKVEDKNIFESATKAFEDAAVKAQDQYFSMLERGQNAALEGYENMWNAINKLDLPTVPGMPAFKVDENAFDGMFDFSAKVIENQRKFAHSMLAVSAKA